MEKQGIETLKEIVDWNLLVFDKIFGLIEKSKKGKRVTGWDAFQFVRPLFVLIPLIGKYKAIGKEWVDLDEQEKGELYIMIQEGLELEDKAVEEIAERMFFLLMELGDFITDLVLATKK